ncbi:MAG: ribonuclease HI [Treponema sp.]|jgi:ribonuclease HI|nr:ribonuclease HI [Treponema sp.]
MENTRDMGTELTIYTDGGCSGNPGPGGWAYIIEAVFYSGAVIEGDRAKEIPESAKIIMEKWGAESNTTNNRMELSAVIAALEALPGLALSPEKITVYTDSQYVQKGITQWIHSWKQNNWRTSGKDPVKNRDLWQRLDELSACFPLVWVWIKGHAGNKMNERCDRMTQEAIASISS